MLGGEAARASWLWLHGRAGRGCRPPPLALARSLILFSQTLQLRAAESPRRLLNTAWGSRAVHQPMRVLGAGRVRPQPRPRRAAHGCHLGASPNTSAVCCGLCCPRLHAEGHRPLRKAARPSRGQARRRAPAAGAAPLGRWVQERVPRGAPRVLTAQVATPLLGVPRGGGGVAATRCGLPASGVFSTGLLIRCTTGNRCFL